MHSNMHVLILFSPSRSLITTSSLSENMKSSG
nr:MAG TPA: hypothetical protein [Caudoviricetes sp.]